MTSVAVSVVAVSGVTIGRSRLGCDSTADQSPCYTGCHRRARIAPIPAIVAVSRISIRTVMAITRIGVCAVEARLGLVAVGPSFCL